MPFKLFFILFLSSNSCFKAISQQVDTLSIFSSQMKKSIKTVVIKPANYSKSNNNFPVVYLLHGYGGSYNNWIKRVPQLMKHATTYQVIIVCPDGGQSSWYVDSPIDSSMAYNSFIAKTIVTTIDATYKTKANKKNRVITGLSMGGYGALHIATTNTNLFGACGSMSGAVNILSLKNKYDLLKRLGDTVQFAERWQQFSPTYFLPKVSNDSLAIIIDCGAEDILYESNITLHKNLLEAKVNHDFIIRPGQHNWAYWSNAIKYQLLFFRNYFDVEVKK